MDFQVRICDVEDIEVNEPIDVAAIKEKLKQDMGDAWEPHGEENWRLALDLFGL